MVRPLAGEGPRARAPDLRFHATFVFFSESIYSYLFRLWLKTDNSYWDKQRFQEGSG